MRKLSRVFCHRRLLRFARHPSRVDAKRGDHFVLADLPGLNAPGVRFVIASFPLTDGARPSRDVKTIIARSVDGRIQTTQEEDTMTQTSATQRGSEQADALRPFNVNFPEAELTELRRRINATKWPERETVTDASQGVQLATSQVLAR